MKTQHQRHLFRGIEIDGDVLQIRSRLSVYGEGFVGELGRERGSEKDPCEEQARSGFIQYGEGIRLDHQKAGIGMQNRR